MSIVETIADGVVAIFNELDLDLAFEATNPDEPTLTPTRKTEEPGICVQAYPFGLDREKVGRNVIRKEAIVSVLVTRQLDKQVTKRRMNSFVEELIDSLEHLKIAGYSFTETETVTLHDTELGKQVSYFGSLHRVTFSAEIMAC